MPVPEIGRRRGRAAWGGLVRDDINSKDDGVTAWWSTGRSLRRRAPAVVMIVYTMENFSSWSLPADAPRPWPRPSRSSRSAVSLAIGSAASRLQGPAEGHCLRHAAGRPTADAPLIYRTAGALTLGHAAGQQDRACRTGGALPHRPTGSPRGRRSRNVVNPETASFHLFQNSPKAPDPSSSPRSSSCSGGELDDRRAVAVHGWRAAERADDLGPAARAPPHERHFSRHAGPAGRKRGLVHPRPRLSDPTLSPPPLRLRSLSHGDASPAEASSQSGAWSDTHRASLAAVFRPHDRHDDLCRRRLLFDRHHPGHVPKSPSITVSWTAKRPQGEA